MRNQTEMFDRHGRRSGGFCMPESKFEYVCSEPVKSNLNKHALLWLEKGIENRDVLSSKSTKGRRDSVYRQSV